MSNSSIFTKVALQSVTNLRFSGDLVLLSSCPSERFQRPVQYVVENPCACFSLQTSFLCSTIQGRYQLRVWLISLIFFTYLLLKWASSTQVKKFFAINFSILSISDNGSGFAHKMKHCFFRVAKQSRGNVRRIALHQFPVTNYLWLVSALNPRIRKCPLLPAATLFPAPSPVPGRPRRHSNMHCQSCSACLA